MGLPKLRSLENEGMTVFILSRSNYDRADYDFKGDSWVGNIFPMICLFFSPIKPTTGHAVPHSTFDGNTIQSSSWILLNKSLPLRNRCLSPPREYFGALTEHAAVPRPSTRAAHHIDINCRHFSTSLMYWIMISANGTTRGSRLAVIYLRRPAP